MGGLFLTATATGRQGSLPCCFQSRQRPRQGCPDRFIGHVAAKGSLTGADSDGDVYVDDLTVERWDSATSDWVTEYWEGFETDANGDAEYPALAHDAAGNLPTGRQA